MNKNFINVQCKIAVDLGQVLVVPPLELSSRGSYSLYFTEYFTNFIVQLLSLILGRYFKAHFSYRIGSYWDELFAIEI